MTVPLEIWHARWFARRSSAAGTGEVATDADETAEPEPEPDAPVRTAGRRPGSDGGGPSGSRMVAEVLPGRGTQGS